MIAQFPNIRKIVTEVVTTIVDAAHTATIAALTAIVNAARDNSIQSVTDSQTAILDDAQTKSDVLTAKIDSTNEVVAAPGSIVRTYASTLDGKALLELNGASYLRTAYPNIESLFPHELGQGLAEADTSAITYGATEMTRYSPKMIDSDGTGLVIAAQSATDGSLGIMRSTDGGLSWAQAYHTGQSAECKGIHICQSGYVYVLIGNQGNSGVACYRSSDNGVNWSAFELAFVGENLVDSCYDPAIDTLFIVATNASNGLRRFQNASSASPTANTYNAPVAPKAITAYTKDATSYLFVKGSNNTSIYRSTDGGSFFSGISSTITGAEGLLMSDNGVLFYSNGSVTTRSLDNGSTWANMPSPFSAGEALYNFTFENGLLVFFTNTAEPKIIVSNDNGETYFGEVSIITNNGGASRSVHVTPDNDIILISSDSISTAINGVSTTFTLPVITSNYPDKIIAE